MYVSVNNACDIHVKTMHILFNKYYLQKNSIPTHKNTNILGLVNRAGAHTSISLKCLQLNRAALKI